MQNECRRNLRTSDFDYYLPKHLIAQEPISKRDSSRMLRLNRMDSSVSHHRFMDLEHILRPGDRLVLNDTRVIPARLFCHKETGGAFGLLFTRRIDARCWDIITKPARRCKTGSILIADADHRVRFTVEASNRDGSRRVVLDPETPIKSIDEVLEIYGSVPLPPYIQREAGQSDRDNYQTVYAQNSGSVAAPTAGLHFTDELLQRLKLKGVSVSTLTLHVGIGTFRPVNEEDPKKHPMHEETYELSQQTVSEINHTREMGGRVIAVGTTVVRVLEHCALGGELQSGRGATRLMIFPGHHFRAIDGLITNFHVPRSTLLMLVSAFAGREAVLEAYGEAVAKEYRFFSYGDAMIIL